MCLQARPRGGPPTVQHRMAQQDARISAMEALLARQSDADLSMRILHETMCDVPPLPMSWRAPRRDGADVHSRPAISPSPQATPAARDARGARRPERRDG